MNILVFQILVKKPFGVGRRGSFRSLREAHLVSEFEELSKLSHLKLRPGKLLD